MLYCISYDSGETAALTNHGTAGGMAVRKWRSTAGMSTGYATNDAAVGTSAEAFYPINADGSLGPAVMLPDSHDKLKVREGTGQQLTFSTHVKWNKNTERSSYSVAGNGYKGLDGWGISIHADGSVQFRSPDRMSASQNLSSPGLVATGVWTHITVIVDEALGTASTRYFVNGTEAPVSNPRPAGERDTVSGTITDSTPYNTQSVYLGVGSHLEGDDSVEYSNPLQGLMDDTALWDEALTTGKAGAIYNGWKTLGYSVAEMNRLFELFNAGAGFVWIQGVTWSNVTGLTSGEGSVSRNEDEYFVQLDAGGKGVAGVFTGEQEPGEGFFFSLLSRPLGEAFYTNGTLWVRSGDYTVGFSQGAGFTIKQAQYKEKPLLTPSGFYQTVIHNTAADTGAGEDPFIGSGHTPEEILCISVTTENGTYDISEFVAGGKTVAGHEFTIHRKTRLGAFYYHESSVTVSEKGIFQDFSYEAIGDTTPLSLMYVFMHCFPKETRYWIAGRSDTTGIVCGEFLSDGSFTYKQDLLWSVVYNPAEQMGLVYQYPEMYAGLSGHRNKFWNRAYDNKLYFTANARRPAGETFSYSVELNAFDAGTNEWEQVAQNRLRTRYPGQNITNLTWTAP